MKPLAQTPLPTRFGRFNMVAYESGLSHAPHMALVRGVLHPEKIQDVRIHSECLTGDLFGSVRCECGEQLETALHHIAQTGGVLVYLRQEGRGIGIVNKMHAYNLQDQGYNTKEANEQLGFHADARSYEVATAILEDLGVRRIRLMTNNPQKIEGLTSHSTIEVVERIPIEVVPRHENVHYLRTKRDEMGHLLNHALLGRVASIAL